MIAPLHSKPGQQRPRPPSNSKRSRELGIKIRKKKLNKNTAEKKKIERSRQQKECEGI